MLSEDFLRREGNYLLLFLLFVVLFIIPIFPASSYKSLYNISFVIIFILATLSTGRLARKIFGITLGVATAEIFSSIFNIYYLEVTSRLMSFVFFYFVVGIMIRRVAKSREVDFLTVIEAINGYLLMGLAFSTVIVFVQLFDTQAFTIPIDPGDAAKSMPDVIYYALVTVTTLGYGDILPQTHTAKSIATLISLSGQVYIAVIIAMLVGKYSANKMGS